MTMAPAPYAIKRAYPRFKLFADAEARLRNGRSIRGQLTELSSGGCYIHTLEPIDIGTPFHLRLCDGIRSCELGGKSIYLHSGSGFGIFGVGVRFETVSADERSRLDAWLGSLGPTFQTASGKCDVQECLHPAKHRAVWLRSGNSQLVCESHKNDIEGKPFSEVSDSFEGKPRSANGKAVNPASRESVFWNVD